MKFDEKKEDSSVQSEVALQRERYRKGRSRKILILVLISSGVLVVAGIALCIGASSVNFGSVWNVFWDLFFPNPDVTDVQRQTVWSLRLPRIIAAVLAGWALSNAGLLMQGVFQNPLVSPYTLGVSNGASFGAAIAILFGSALSFLNFGNYLIPAFAFLFAIVTMALVFAISKVARDQSKTLVLSGTAIGYLFTAMVSLLKYVADVDALPDLVFWSMGSLSSILWDKLLIMAVVVVACFIVMMRYAWDLNVMALGEEAAVSLGVNFKKVRMIAFIISTLLTAVTVSFTGVIGFVGLIAPHVTKMIVGSDFRYSLPVSSAVGALLLLASDTLGRTILGATQLPVGIITSFIGVPFFLYLVARKRRA